VYGEMSVDLAEGIEERGCRLDADEYIESCRRRGDMAVVYGGDRCPYSVYGVPMGISAYPGLESGSVGRRRSEPPI